MSHNLDGARTWQMRESRALRHPSEPRIVRGKQGRIEGSSIALGSLPKGEAYQTLRKAYGKGSRLRSPLV